MRSVRSPSSFSWGTSCDCMQDPPRPTEELLERWRHGDRTASNELLAELSPWLHLEMRREMDAFLRRDVESLDLAQAAVANFLHRGVRFVPASVAQFRALLRRIAVNELKDQWRRQKRAGAGRHIESLLQTANPLSGFCTIDSSAQPERAAAQAEEAEWVRLALQFLAEEDRWLLLASEVEGLDWTSIAAELQLATPDAARMRAARLKPRVANLLRQLKAGRMPETD